MIPKEQLRLYSKEISGIHPETEKQESKPIGEKVTELIEERAAGLNRIESFGTSERVAEIGFESLLPSLVKAELSDDHPRVMIGSPQCRQPYAASILNGSALSFGPMGKNFILAFNKAAHAQGFFQNTGEAGVSPYHFGVDIDIEAPNFDSDVFFEDLKNGVFPELLEAGDLVWQIGNGYFGCRGVDGYFDSVQFQKKATLSTIKMIEVKLSQGVEPSKEMPVKQVTAGMIEIMGLKGGGQAKLQNFHSSFSTPVELMQFIQQLRTLSEGKPIGIKLGISHKHYFMSICKAMIKTGILLDFITVDGMEAGTAAAHQGSLGFTDTLLDDAIPFVHNVLVGTNLRKYVKIIASGRVFTERDIISKLARGADLCSTARGILLATGCDQQRVCYSGTCSRGIATQDPNLLRNFDIMHNVNSICNYHRITIQELNELLSIVGVKHPNQVGPYHMQKRMTPSEISTLDEVYEFIQPGSLLTPFAWFIAPRYRIAWTQANSDLPFVQAMSQHRNLNGRE